jgi:hypothetical protein
METSMARGNSKKLNLFGMAYLFS